MLQVTALLAMEPPVASDHEARRTETARVFKAMRPLDPANCVRGQFRGYREVAGVAPDSRVETFAAVRLHVDTWRWAGVPFYIRAGKCLPVTATEVLVELNRPPLDLFEGQDKEHANFVRFRLSPAVFIALHTQAKKLGEQMAGETVELLAPDQSDGQ